jgi:quercetin 2,3-dioxygenase
VVVEIRRGTDRFVERTPERRTAHAFSFGSTYDPQWVRFGPMVCHDDHLLRSGTGFEEHSHSGLDVVTWVVSGALTHTDPSGSVTLSPGEVGLLRSGSGVAHSEIAAAPQTRFVQVWLATDSTAAPSYEVTSAPLSLPGATFRVVSLGEGETVTVEPAPRVHVYVARGALVRSSLAEPLHVGDAFLFTDEPALELTAGVDTDLLVWSFLDEDA